VPRGLEHERFRLRVLTVRDVLNDYEAIRERVAPDGTANPPEGLTLEQNLIDLGWHQKEFQLRRSFAYTVVAPDGTANPPEGLTLEQNLIDLGWHQKEFQLRRSFAYTVVAPDESRVLGCAYLYPSDREGYDARAQCWVRRDAAELDGELYRAFRAWVEAEWPLEHVWWPGRDDA
jgi:hypothetical protein